MSESINVEVISDEPPVISGVTDSTIKAGEVAKFNKLANITVTDDHDTNININVTGEIKIPKAGTDETYTLTYTATDSDGNTTTIIRNITVTNQIPVINGLDEVTLISGIGFDNLANVTATDLEDGVIQNIEVSGDYNEKVAGKYVLTYKATDSDGNTAISTRNINVLYDTEETTNSDTEYVIKPKDETELNNIIEEIKKYDEKAEVVNMVEEKDFKIYKIKLVKKNLRTNEIYIELKVSKTINTDIDLPGATKPEDPTIPSEPEEPITPDVELTDIKGHWAEDFINDFVSKGYIGGYDDNTFRPNNSITRAEFVKIVNRTFGFTEKATEGFKDVASNKWYYDDILIAKKAGYIDGYDDNTFRPDNLITREEASKIIATVKGYKGDGILDFDDASQISNWAKSYVDALCDNNIINGYDDNTFKPKNRITRAETVKMLNLSE